MTQVRPLHLWKVTHLVPEGDDYTESSHFLILPSRDIYFVWHTLGVGTWSIGGKEPSAIEWIEQVSNMVCYSQNENSSPLEVQRLQYYNPATDRHVNFDREIRIGNEKESPTGKMSITDYFSLDLQSMLKLYVDNLESPKKEPHG